MSAASPAIVADDACFAALSLDFFVDGRASASAERFRGTLEDSSLRTRLLWTSKQVISHHDVHILLLYIPCMISRSSALPDSLAMGIGVAIFTMKQAMSRRCLISLVSLVDRKVSDVSSQNLGRLLPMLLLS